MNKLIFSLLPMLSLVTLCAFAGEFACTPEDARRAELVADNLKNWDEVYRAYKKYSACDDGAIGEGFSDSIGRLLAQDWNTVIRLSEFAKKDRGFKKFVFKHIDETLPDETLRAIKENTRNRCPTHQVDFCRHIEYSADR